MISVLLFWKTFFLFSTKISSGLRRENMKKKEKKKEISISFHFFTNIQSLTKVQVNESQKKIHANVSWGGFWWESVGIWVLLESFFVSKALLFHFLMFFEENLQNELFGAGNFTNFKLSVKKKLHVTKKKASSTCKDPFSQKLLRKRKSRDETMSFWSLKL